MRAEVPAAQARDYGDTFVEDCLSRFDEGHSCPGIQQVLVSRKFSMPPTNSSPAPYFSENVEFREVKTVLLETTDLQVALDAEPHVFLFSFFTCARIAALTASCGDLTGGSFRTAV
jgi:hypothetical protein